MALPKLNVAKYTTTLPISEEEIQYRPFLVGEEKVLLIAQQSEDDKKILKAVNDVIDKCTFGAVKAEDLSMTDFEYLFLQLRIVSKGETSTVGIACSNAECGKTHDVDVDLSKHEVTNLDINPQIYMEEEVGVLMRPPSLKLMKLVSKKQTDFDQSMSVVMECIHAIYDKDGVTYTNDITPKELSDWLEQMTDDQFKKITDYVEQLPAIRFEIDHICPHCTHQNKSIIEGINNFF